MNDIPADDPYVVLISGSRKWSGYTRITDRLRQLPLWWRQHTLIHGGAKGVDQFADWWARHNDLTVISEPVPEEEWQRLGRRAGPLRNSRMLEHRPDLVICFWDEASRGTRDMFTKALKAMRTTNGPKRVEIHLSFQREGPGETALLTWLGESE